MELRQLERFLAVVDHGTLAAAARRLGLTQQALSASLAGLENELELRLLDRAPGGITRLTEYGRALVPHARSQLAADRRARDELLGLKEGRRGTVTIGIGETFAGDVVASAVSTLHRQRPWLRINLVEGYSERILERLYEGEFDFVAGDVSGVTLPDGFAGEVIYSASDVVAARPRHPLAGRDHLELADLQGFTWLVPYSRPSDVDAITEAFTAEGLEAPGRFIGSDAYRIGMKLMAGNDFLLMTSPALVTSLLATRGYGIRVLPIDRPSVRRNASLVFSVERPLTPGASLLLEAVRTATRERAGEDWGRNRSTVA